MVKTFCSIVFLLGMIPFHDGASEVLLFLEFGAYFCHSRRGPFTSLWKERRVRGTIPNLETWLPFKSIQLVPPTIGSWPRLSLMTLKQDITNYPMKTLKATRVRDDLFLVDIAVRTSTQVVCCVVSQNIFCFCFSLSFTRIASGCLDG